jgi:ParB family transcriptional regulator, chromosome partitioning protein
MDIALPETEKMESKEVLEDIKLDEFDTSLSIYRLLYPGQIKLIQQSMERVGQLQPVITRKKGDLFQLIDGFKRFYAGEQLVLPSLLGKVLDVNESLGKAMILAYNRDSHSLVDYEEGLIVFSLKKEHLMNQKQISDLTGYSQSWVCRRISLVERLEEMVQTQLRMGKISAAHARAIIKLPRGNQGELTQSIIAHQISSRQSAWLIERYLSSKNKAERDYLLNHPGEAIGKATKESEIYDSRLCKHGNQLLKTTELLYMQQNIFFSQYSHIKTDTLSESERMILHPRLQRVSQKATAIASVIDKKTLAE